MLQEVIEMLASQLGKPADSITAESDIVKDLGADSLDVVELLMALEDKYGVTIPEDDIVKVATVKDVADIIEKLK